MAVINANYGEFVAFDAADIVYLPKLDPGVAYVLSLVAEGGATIAVRTSNENGNSQLRSVTGELVEATDTTKSFEVVIPVDGTIYLTADVDGSTATLYQTKRRDNVTHAEIARYMASIGMLTSVNTGPRTAYVLSDAAAAPTAEPQLGNPNAPFASISAAISAYTSAYGEPHTDYMHVHLLDGDTEGTTSSFMAEIPDGIDTGNKLRLRFTSNASYSTLILGIGDSQYSMEIIGFKGLFVETQFNAGFYGSMDVVLTGASTFAHLISSEATECGQCIIELHDVGEYTISGNGHAVVSPSAQCVITLGNCGARPFDTSAVVFNGAAGELNFTDVAVYMVNSIADTISLSATNTPTFQMYNSYALVAPVPDVSKNSAVG